MKTLLIPMLLALAAACTAPAPEPVKQEPVQLVPGYREHVMGLLEILADE